MDVQTLSDGNPSTLETYRKYAVALYGEDSEAVKFFDNKIADSPNGEKEEVIAAESQMMYLLMSFASRKEETEK